ncbi:MAG: hypothetical protein O9339_08920 [Rubrivivax sp.]|nr:hypothetical protein [Rubrivivax sp.]
MAAATIRASAGPSGFADVDASPELVGVSLEADVEERVLEADGVVVAPLPEVLGVRELDGLLRSQSTPWDFLSFDIETSCNAL